MAISSPELLTAAHDVSEFSCGKPSLDRWLKTRALSNQEKGFTAVIVVHEANRLIGYYGLAPMAILPSALPRSIRTGLLKHALLRCVAAAGLIGGRALVVNAVDVEAADFWLSRGFLPSKDDPLVLFRSMADIAAAIASRSR